MSLKENSQHNEVPTASKRVDSTKIKAHKLFIIKALEKQRCQMSISVEGSDTTSMSIILDSNAKGEWLELDELADSSAHAALLETKNYQASGWQKGINVHFTARILSHRQNNGLIRYRSTLPDTIYQDQHRASYRSPVSMMSAPEVHLILKDNQVINGHINDISVHGALISVPAGSPLGPGDKIAQCIFKTSDNKTIIVEADVRRQSDTENSSRTRLGCRFTHLDLTTTQEIRRYAAAIERQNARRR